MRKIIGYRTIERAMRAAGYEPPCDGGSYHNYAQLADETYVGVGAPWANDERTVICYGARRTSAKWDDLEDAGLLHPSELD